MAPPGAPFLLNDELVQSLQVRYTAEDGERVVTERSFPKGVVDKLVAGERLEIIYIPDNRRRFYFKDEKLPRNWGWLALGVGMLVLFVIAVRLPHGAEEGEEDQ